MLFCHATFSGKLSRNGHGPIELDTGRDTDKDMDTDMDKDMDIDTNKNMGEGKDIRIWPGRTVRKHAAHPRQHEEKSLLVPIS